MELLFTISEAHYTTFAIGARTFDIKCKRAPTHNRYNVPERDLFSTMRGITEGANACGIAVIFDIE